MPVKQRVEFELSDGIPVGLGSVGGFFSFFLFGFTIIFFKLNIINIS